MPAEDESGSMVWAPTRNLPFGRDVDTLVLCKNNDRLDFAIRALGIKARYEVWAAVLMGSRFKKIIWLGGWGDSASERAETGRMIRERLPTLLERDGEIFIL